MRSIFAFLFLVCGLHAAGPGLNWPYELTYPGDFREIFEYPKRLFHTTNENLEAFPDLSSLPKFDSQAVINTWDKEVLKDVNSKHPKTIEHIQTGMLALIVATEQISNRELPAIFAEYPDILGKPKYEQAEIMRRWYKRKKPSDSMRMVIAILDYNLEYHIRFSDNPEEHWKLIAHANSTGGSLPEGVVYNLSKKDQ
jgi:hypothetical protein